MKTVIALILIGIAVYVFLTSKYKMLDYTSPDFRCSTNYECREWARINNRHPGIMCIGNYICKKEGTCSFECGVN